MAKHNLLMSKYIRLLGLDGAVDRLLLVWRPDGVARWPGNGLCIECCEAEVRSN